LLLVIRQGCGVEYADIRSLAREVNDVATTHPKRDSEARIGHGRPGSDKNPDFNNRLVVVERTPFVRGRWTHIAIAYSGLGGGSGEARLYLNGKLQGTTPKISEALDWDIDRSAIRLGVNYVGLMDDVAIFRRPLTAQEIGALFSDHNW
jgi:hypothetical protein